MDKMKGRGRGRGRRGGGGRGGGGRGGGERGGGARGADTYPNLMMSEPARAEQMVQRASLHELFFSSVANTAPRCMSNLERQSTPPENWKWRVGWRVVGVKNRGKVWHE